MIKLVIFDLDGTLLDTIGDLSAACDAVLSARRLPRHTWDGYRRMVGNGIRRLVERALPESMRDDATIESVREQFVEYYIDHIDVHTRPYDGIAEVVGQLAERGVKLAVVSNKFQAGTEKLIRRFFGDTEFLAVYGQREGVPLKPDPQADFEIMRMAEADASEVLHIGDSSVDIATAKAAGVRSVGVVWGFRPREEIVAAGADFVAESAADILKIVEKL